MPAEAYHAVLRGALRGEVFAREAGRLRVPRVSDSSWEQAHAKTPSDGSHGRGRCDHRFGGSAARGPFVDARRSEGARRLSGPVARRRDEAVLSAAGISRGARGSRTPHPGSDRHRLGCGRPHVGGRVSGVRPATSRRPSRTSIPSAASSFSKTRTTTGRWTSAPCSRTASFRRGRSRRSTTASWCSSRRTSG